MMIVIIARWSLTLPSWFAPSVPPRGTPPSPPPPWSLHWAANQNHLATRTPESHPRIFAAGTANRTECSAELSRQISKALEKRRRPSHLATLSLKIYGVHWELCAEVRSGTEKLPGLFLISNYLKAELFHNFCGYHSITKCLLCNKFPCFNNLFTLVMLPLVATRLNYF
jgi:hypothetical protein